MSAAPSQITRMHQNSTFCLNDNLWDDVTLKDVSGIGTDSFFSTYEKYFTTGENTETT